MFKLLACVAAIVAAMVAIKDGRALERAGLLSSCSAVAPPAGADGFWQACRGGRLEGRPNLRRKSCTSQGVVAGIEYWRCPAPTDTGRST